ncbi:hypothetical protein A9Q99_20605 [Gammaproteobacteria bacterium 45_16_T64]|nr:hypothetical protein A9Q99_20605 [Gammaproteobacteria bacterium 45_16_T64]
MKPISLEMSAFGSFPNTEVINFDRFGEAPLFLINGPTGSGKTTILDAICFALYGETTGEEREARQMRCDFSEPAALTEVILEFELAKSRYRIRRVPEQLRPKAKGEGTTVQAPEAQLWSIDEFGEPQVIVSKKVKEATLEITTLTGLTVSQFRQVMVLPQGKFRQLLLADSKDREKIFSQLFQTGMYKTLEDKLKAKANAIAADVSQQQQLQRGVLEGASVVDDEALLCELGSCQESLAAELDVKKRYEKNVANLELQLHQQEILKDAFERCENTQQSVDALLLKNDEMGITKKRIVACENAAVIQPIYLELERTKKELSAISAGLDSIDALKQQAETELQHAEVERIKVESELPILEGNKKDVDYLCGLKDRAVIYGELQRNESTEIARLEGVREAKEKALAVVEAEVESQNLLLRSISEVQKRIADNDNLPVLQSDGQKKVSIKQQADEVVNAVSVQRSQLSLLKTEGAELKKNYEQAVTDTQRKTMLWHQGQAAILAASLSDGEPCIVCGSEEHPLPAHQLNADVPSQEDLEYARKIEHEFNQALMSAREKYAQMATRLSSDERRVTTLNEELGDSSCHSLVMLQEQLSRLTESLEQWGMDKRNLQSMQLQQDGREDTLSRARLNLENVREEETRINASYAAIKARCVQAAQEIPEEYRSSELLLNRIDKLQQEVDKFEEFHANVRRRWEGFTSKLHGLVSQKKEREDSRSRAFQIVADTESRWSMALEKSVLANQEEFAASCVAPDQLSSMQHAVKAFENQLAQQKGALAEQLSYLAGKERPEISLLNEEIKTVKGELLTVNSKWLTLDKRVSALLSAQHTLASMRKKSRELEEAYGLYGTLSNVANGQTHEKISLQRFVLGVLLDDVLVEASQRLQLMSKGRYLLLRKSEKAKGNKASGLELVVDDAYTGVQRPVATLSGGESFMAALSLALGLSDVVQAYSGGVRLDMLFIDEGFGSLDPESLELSIRTLLDLQEAGRMVGVISHVADLREQISLRLDVISSHRGSRTELAGVVV